MLKKLLNFKILLSLLIISLVGLSFLAFALNQENYSYDLNLAKRYAPDFWFDSEEKYYPCDYSEFYYDKNGNEIPGDVAVSNYNKLTKEEKLNHFKIFYKVKHKPEEIVIEYWLFYVKDEFINKHYGDTEYVFVFLDSSGKVEKVIASEHWGDKLKAFLANAELDDPRVDHIRILVENGSHANWIDGNRNGMVDRGRDITNWYESYGTFLFSDWSVEDKVNGVKLVFNDPRYRLIPLSKFQEKMKNKENLTNSPELGIPLFGHYLPLGGKPADLAAVQDKIEDPERTIPFTFQLARKKITNKWNIAKNKMKDTVGNFERKAKEFGERMKSFLNISSLWSARVSQNYPERAQEASKKSENITFSTENSLVENLEKQVNKKKNPENTNFPVHRKNITASDLQKIEKELKNISWQVSQLQDKVNSLQTKKGEKESKGASQGEKRNQVSKPENFSQNSLSKERKIPSYSPLPSPGASLVSFSFNKRQNNKQNQESQENNESQEGSNNNFPVVISEVFFDAEISDEGNEFIELFNQSDKEIDISNWSLQYLSANADSLEKIKRKNFREGDKILPKRYFLIGVNGREGDMKWKSLSLSNKGATIFLVRNQGPESEISNPDDKDIVDRISYGQGSGLIFPEKKAVNISDFHPGESIGRIWKENAENYQDTNNNSVDFEIQIPTPKEKNQPAENPSPPSSPEIVIEDAESVLNLTFEDKTSDIEDVQDVPPQSLEETYVSHADSSFTSTLAISSDVTDPYDAPSQSISQAYVSHGESVYPLFLMLMEELFLR